MGKSIDALLESLPIVFSFIYESRNYEGGTIRTTPAQFHRCLCIASTGVRNTCQAVVKLVLK